MIRSCVIPNNEFENVTKSHVEAACQKFYVLFETLFGALNCSYSVHVVSSHLLKIRGKMPLTFKSAFKFESFFSEMRNLFHPGTNSSIKQVLQNSHMKRILENHACEKKIFFSCEKQPKLGKKFNPGKECNSLVYIFNEKKETQIYSIVEKITDKHFRCKIQGKFTFKTPLTPEYTWSSVGVYKLGPISEDLEIINVEDISGKVIKINNFLITCPNNVLREQ